MFSFQQHCEVSCLVNLIHMWVLLTTDGIRMDSEMYQLLFVPALVFFVWLFIRLTCAASGLGFHKVFQAVD